jgi:hypothetical protein
MPHLPLLKKIARSLRFAPVLAMLPIAGCSSADTTKSGEDDVTDVKQSTVKDQSTDNCWAYATMGWTEALVLRANNTPIELSESYVTYWHWFEQIVNGEVEDDKIEEGGSWGEAADLMVKYGVMESKDFIPGDVKAELSDGQAAALKAIGAALKAGGALHTDAQRSDRAHVRQVLDQAFGLSPAVKTALDDAFGANVAHTLDSGARLAQGSPIKNTRDLPAKVKNPDTGRFNTVSIADAIGTHKSSFDQEHRRGALAWNDVSYPIRGAQARRDFMKRVQRALADGEPIILNWYVDFAALTKDGKFPEPPKKPGSQGGHVVIIVDYQVENVPGFGTLPAGVVETRPEALNAALADEASVTFLRIKNSWGTHYHPLAAPAPAGDHDLFLNYLNGPIQECDMDAKDKPIMSTCVKAVPFESVVLPAGY